VLFATYTPSGPPSNYPSGRALVNPWLIILSACGGCVVVAVIGAFTVGYMVYKQPALQRGLSATVFLNSIRSHQYARAERALAVSARSKYSPVWLAQRESEAERSLGKLNAWNVTYHIRRGQGLGDVNKLLDVPYEMVYAKGTRTIVLHYDSATGDNKIAAIQWNDTGNERFTKP
jgi:hypothetical protein